MRVGIIGAGLMGFWHAKASKKAGGHIVAVMDIDPKASKSLADRFNAESFFNIEQMLKQVKLDLLHICTPFETHYKYMALAIETGLHIIIEKPILATSKETEYLYCRAEEKNLLICPVHQCIFQEGVLKAKKALQQIGRIVHMEGTVCSAGGKDLAQDKLDIIVGDILPHPLSLMQLFLTETLSEEGWTTVMSGAGELRTLCDHSGLTLSIFISMNARPTEFSFKIVGRHGTIYIDLFHGFMFLEPGSVSKVKKIARPFELAARIFSAATMNLVRRVMRQDYAYPGLQRLIDSFYQAVRTGGQASVSREDTVAIARVRDKLILGYGLVQKI